MAALAKIGEAIDRLANDVRRTVLDCTGAYRNTQVHSETERTALIRRAVDAPNRARAQLNAWMADYDARKGAGQAQAFLASALAAAGSTKTLGDVSAELATLESQAIVLRDHVLIDGWSWDQIADQIEASVSIEADEDFIYTMLPMPAGYLTIWGDQW